MGISHWLAMETPEKDIPELPPEFESVSPLVDRFIANNRELLDA